jgi:predicted transcriptional regulator of viral defense system
MLVYLAMYKDPGIPPGQVVVTIKPDITQVDMARLMGIHRVTLTKAVSKLKKQGILEHFSKNKLVILNFPVLCTLTGGY